jgi:hypothetical protein
MDTTATVRAQGIEDQKAELDNRIADIRQYRDTFPFECVSWNRYDKEIDNLLAEKDALTACPSAWLEGDPEHDPDCQIALSAAVATRIETSDEYKRYAQLANLSERDNLYELGMGR